MMTPNIAPNAEQGALEPYRVFITRWVGPVNAVICLFTGLFIPIADVLRPKYPNLLSVVAIGVAVVFAIFVSITATQAKKRIPFALNATLGLCAALFAVAAFASTRFKEGQIAANDAGIRELQVRIIGLQQGNDDISKALSAQRSVLEDIKAGRSDDPRVVLHNMGIAWNKSGLLEAVHAGDVRVVKLFLDGGMAADDVGSGYTLAGQIVLNKAPNSAELLAALQDHMVDLRSEWRRGCAEDVRCESNLYALAVESKNLPAQTYLLSHGFRKGDYDQWLVKKKSIKRESGYWF